MAAILAIPGRLHALVGAGRAGVAAALHVRGLASGPEKGNVVGFVGLGNMGAPMAANMIKSGKKVVVFDLNKTAVEGLVSLGAQAASSAANVAKQARTVVTMLPSSPHVRSVYCDDNGILSVAEKGTLLIDASTIDPAVSREVASMAEAKGVQFVEAPVSGGVGAAQAGSLTFMVGATPAAFATAKPLLQAMGKNIVHCGGAGAGQVTKLCNNMLLGITMIGVSEAMALGVRNGLDPKLLASVINTSSGRCWSSDTYNPCPGVMENVPASRGYTGGFGSQARAQERWRQRVADIRAAAHALVCGTLLGLNRHTQLMHKDLGLAMAAASANKVPTPMGSLAYQVYSMMLKMGYDGKDFSSVFEFLGGGGARKA